MLRELLQNPENKRLPQAELSKKISVMWKTETAESRGKFEHLANLSKTQHQLDFPDYQFRPQKRADKEKERAEKKKEKDRERAEQRLAKLDKCVQSSSSASAPTPHSIVDGHSSTPAPSTSQLPPAASTSSTQLQNVHSHMVDRYGVCGPSPPLSQAPSPYGSPAMEGFSLNEPQGSSLQELTEHDASFAPSRYASGSSYVAPEVGASHQLSTSRERRVPVALPRPVIPIRPPSTTGWDGAAPPRSALEAPSASSSSLHPAVTHMGTGAEGDGVVWAQTGLSYANHSESQDAFYNVSIDCPPHL